MDFSKIWHLQLLTFQDQTVLTVGHLITALVVMLLGLLISSWISRMLGKRMTKARMGPDSVLALRKLIFVMLVVVTVLTALSVIKVPITSFAFMSGAIALGVGFGAQNIINNYISGWILMSERPVRIGDFIDIDDSKGLVERIGNRSTQIRRVDGVHIMVPNSLLLERTLINWTLVDNDIRTGITVGVAYGSPVRKVEELMLQTMSEHKGILKTPAPSVMFSDFGDSALVFESLFWCQAKGERELRTIRSDLRFRTDELFREHNITIAFPQQDVHLFPNGPIEVISRTATASDQKQANEPDEKPT